MTSSLVHIAHRMGLGFADILALSGVSDEWSSRPLTFFFFFAPLLRLLLLLSPHHTHLTHSLAHLLTHYFHSNDHKMKKKISKKRIQNKQQEAASVFSSEEEEVAHLEAKVAEQAPASGSQPANSSDLTFANMPLSSRTKEGLALSGLKTPTDIQAATLPHALAGKDILGAAKTGSGKTLSFVIPVLEKLFRERWGVTDGLGALIITPTRELALQIFEVLRGVGRKHQISAGLVTGGKKELEEEQDRVVGMNVLVATPGRLLQHLEQTPGFDASQLMMLVLDEADRILDMGFKQQLGG